VKFQYNTSISKNSILVFARQLIAEPIEGQLAKKQTSIIEQVVSFEPD